MLRFSAIISSVVHIRKTYNDSARYVTVRSDLSTKGDGKKVATQFYDQLGRVRLSKTLEDAATQSATNETDGIKVQTRYKSAPGYTYQLTSNPYRAATSSQASDEETMGWTLSTAWASGMRSEVETFSGAGLPTVFGGSNTNSTGIVRTDVDTNATTVTDQAGKVRRSITNALGWLTRVDEPTASGLGPVSSPNQATNYSYDILDNLTGVSQGVQTRSFTYSSLSRLLNATNPESGTISYQYDANGNLTSKTDARNITTTFAYDALNRVVSRSYSDSTPAVDYFYDNLTNAKGKLIKVASEVSTTEYTSFDILGRVTGHRQTTDGEEYETAYGYNLAGGLVEETYPSGRVVKNVLDNNGDLSIVESKKTSSSGFWHYADSFTYNPAGAVTSMQLGNGRWESTTFNSRLQPTRIALGVTTGTTGLLQLDYSYGTTANNGNVQSQTITVPTVGQNTGFVAVQNYSYDSLNRLKDATENITPNGGSQVQSWKQTFTFDRYGNRRFDFTNGNTTFPDPNCTEAICNPTISTTNNRLTSTGWIYDSSGNTTGDPYGRTLIYDGENKQVKVLDSQQTTIGEYFYDGDGKRVKKYVPDTGETTVFVYDAAGKLVAEYSTQVTSQQDAKVAYLTNDHLGSPRINTDANGAVTARHDYMPFGEEIATSQRTSGLGYADDTVRKQFTGYERDIESELDFAQARYYSNRLGRFYSPDPENEGSQEDDPQSWNAYAYSRNNPVVIVDTDGRKWRVCDSNGQCVVISDEEATHTLFNRKGNHPEIIRKGGKIFDEDGNQTGTYERISFDDFDDRQNEIIFGHGGLVDYSKAVYPYLKKAEIIVDLFSVPVSAEGLGEGVLTQGNRLIQEIEGTIDGIKAGATLVKDSSALVMEKTTAGVAEATKDFNRLSKLGGRVVTKGSAKIVELKNGFIAKLRPSSDGRITLEIQRRSKDIGVGAGKKIEIRYGPR